MNEEPSVLTRMRLSCCWGDNLNEKELNEVVDYINYLQQENKELKEELKQIKTEPLTNRISRIDSVIANIYKENQQLKEENFNLREYINIDKMSVPYKSDSFEELMTMPTYKKLEQKLDLYKSVLDEIREYIEKHKMIACDEFEYISTSPDTMLQILDKANEQKW